ncbi:hypothetical protein C0585_04625 [Candidatus Woesearchaeota archaeon]|nr:MAG: hypothetical protein C0585_04625 [Candidatus Woesearchaeota archaeon]
MAKIYIETYGCAVNQSDSELMAGLLQDEGHKIIDNPKDSDVIIINTCTVKNSAESKLYRALKKYEDRKIIIAGCIPQAEKSLIDNELKDYSIIGIKQMINAPLAVEETIKGNRIVIIDRVDNKRLNLAKIRQNNTVEIIPINEGCVGSCNYCKTKHARGNVKSYLEKEIINQAKQAIEEGVKQIWLTSQDTGAYGLDTKTNIIELLKKIIEIKGEFKVRLGMINPEHAKKYLKDLIPLLKNEKMFKFIHIPIQSGSNKVIKEMNRNYKQEDFQDIVKELRKKVKGIRIATDIIIGYPTETDEDFEDTYNLIKELKIEVVNRSRYWKRPNTPAAKLKPINTKTVKNRSIRIKELFEVK